MLLKDLFNFTGINLPISLQDIEIMHISHDSRTVKPNSLFLAWRGTTTNSSIDGHKYIESAVKMGAVVVVGTDDINEKYKDIYIKVSNSKKIWAILSYNWFGRPSDDLKFIGITGTDGKTTTCNFVYSILKEAQKKVSILSTINTEGYHVTTPDAYDLQRVLKKIKDEGKEWVILETSSHALAYDKVFPICYEISGLTNITPEHLDYHKTFENYINAKSKLFIQSKISILPDNETGQKVKDIINDFDNNKFYLFNDGETDNKDFHANKFLPKKHEIYFYNQNDLPLEVNLQLPGNYNLKNAALASKITKYIGIEDKWIKSGLEKVSTLKGRWEIMYKKESVIIVDFAHTPNSFNEVLFASRDYMNKNNLNGRLIHIFGCAGERDNEKRFDMGYLSGKLSDISIITSEDPRRENISDIDRSIIKGLEKSGKIQINTENIKDKKGYMVLNWRGTAIFYAIRRLMQPGDFILITGKGHEESMCFGTTEYPWTDQKCVEENIKLL